MYLQVEDEKDKLNFSIIGIFIRPREISKQMLIDLTDELKRIDVIHNLRLACTNVFIDNIIFIAVLLQLMTDLLY